ncbi:alpha/beta hydrolase [Amycolatopsis sp. FU40]|uniref:alpha/beta fold hydrolase n=1 Tax=Amycolatopsis sp. FU40 TaxID=2914159 RepID=UPI001F1EA9CA|nr:alpha/beta hydrolase [Amycolatopsis sp. FU40]UKD50997.1 alpha/beta hydrolase [Amycolatopsis sp. FU40]
MPSTLLLVHGGLADDMDADRFWTRPGITGGLRRDGRTVLVPDRLREPPDWSAEAAHLASFLPGQPVVVVAGSNGCSAAVRLALDFPRQVDRLLLAWPATAGDAAVDARAASVPRALLGGETLRGVADADLATLALPVGVLPSVPDNPFHQRRTVDALLRLVPGCTELPGCPEPPRPGFESHVDDLLASIAGFAGR